MSAATPIRQRVEFELLEDRLLFSATPGATVDVPDQAKLNESFDGTVTFNNSGTDPGYGPFIDLRAAKGVDIDTPPTYLGASVNVAQAVDNSTGTTAVTFEHPYTQQTVTVQPGEEYYVFELPFGSVVPAQPNATIHFTGTLDKSEGATAGVPLTIEAQSGFRFGEDPENNPATDPPIVSPVDTDTITPTIWEVSKTVLAPENETATGPNFAKTWQITIDIADGETVTNINISDLLPDNIQFVSLQSVTNPYTTVSLPSTTTPGGTLALNFASATGTTSDSDIVITYLAYVPQNDASANPVLNPSTGAPTTSVNGVDGTSLYDPGTGNVPLSDTVASPVDLPNQDTLTDRSLAVQKGNSIINDVGAPGLSPGDTIEYTLNIQVSDYFRFQNLSIADELGDGQHVDTTFTPTLFFRENGIATSGTFTGADFTFLRDGGTGVTDITFDISGAMVSLGGDSLLTGDLFGLDNTLTSGTIATITYHVVVDSDFLAPTPNSPSIGSGDTIGNNATINGTVNPFIGGGSTVTDGTSSSLTASSVTLDKSVYAVNGDTSAVGSFGPGDTVTYDLNSFVPGAVDNFVVTDFVPLPKFLVTELSSTPVMVFVSDPATYTPGTLNAGEIVLVFDSDLFNAGSVSPTITIFPAGNVFQVDYGDLVPSGAASYDMRILFTVTATDAAVADGLLLTNEMIGTWETSAGIATGNAAVDIAQVIVEDPELGIYKGVVGYEDTGLTLGGLTFQAPNAGNGVTGTLNGTATATAIDQSDLLGNEIDGNDVTRFGIVLENTGRTDAFNVIFDDQIPLGFVLPASAAAMNLTLRTGGGTTLTLGSDYTITFDSANRTFTIELVDNGGQGGINQGRLGNGTAITDGSNYILVTYDLTAASDIDSGGSFTNTATLSNYTGTESSTNNRVPDGLDAIAEVTTKLPVISKTLVGTSLVETNNSNTQAVIGEVATYQLVVTVAEGSTRNSVIEDLLDNGLVYVAGSATATGSGISASLNTSVAGQTITFDLGDILNSADSNGTAETITITYQARVANVVGNQQGTQLNNSAEFGWTTADQTTNPLASATNNLTLAPVAAANITVIEPVVTIDKTTTAISGSVDAGDSVSYTISYTADASRPTAYDTQIYDPLPTPLGNPVIAGVIDSAGLLTAADFVISATGVLTYVGGQTIDMAPGRSISVTVSGTVAGTVQPGQTINNAAGVGWTSLNGADANERTGADGIGGALNDYVARDDVSFTIRNVDVTKTLVATSEASTTGSNVVVGEIVRYRIEVTIPEGQTAQFVLKDLLPAGLTFLDDGTATIQAVGSLQTSGFGSLAAGALPGTPTLLGDANIGSDGSMSSDPDSYTSGTDVWFKLGDITNPDRNDAQTESIIIEFSAIADNSTAGSNDAGDVLANQAAALSLGTTLDTSNTVSVTVHEPVVTLDKTLVTPGNGVVTGGGQPVEYSFTLTNPNGTNGATAFDISFSDLIPAELENLILSAISTTGTVTGVSAQLTGNTLTLSVDSMAQGATVTFTVSGDTIAALPAATTVTNTANLVYTSLPGTNGTVANPTGSVVPGASGSALGERNGSGGINDYATTDDAQFISAGSLVVKTYKDSSLSEDDTSAPTSTGNRLQIGETITFDVVVVAFQGVSTNVVLTDVLPEGYRLDSYQVLTTAGSNPYITQDFGGTFTPMPPPGGTGLSITGPANAMLSLGTVDTSGGDPTAVDNIFAVRVVATAINVAANQNGDVLANGATITYDTSGGTITLTSPNSPTGQIVEPDLEISKSVTGTNIEAGDTVTYTITVEHTGNSTAAAFDLDLTDSFPTDLLAPTIVTATIDGVDVSSFFSFSGSTLVTTVGAVDLLLGQRLVLTLSGVVADTAFAGEILSNTVNLTWTSMDGVVADERTGADGIGGALNDYAATANAPDVVIVGALDVDKRQISPADGKATIGEGLTYSLEVTLAEGTTSNLQIVDQLSPGMGYVPGSALVFNPATMTLAPLVETYNAGTGTITFSFSSAVLQGITDSGATGTLDTDTFFIVYRTTVLDQAPAQDGATLPNTVTATAAGLGPATDSESMLVVEPDLSITKVTSNTNVEAGDTVTYTITIQHTGASTSNAYDLNLSDTLPAELSNLQVVSATIGGTDISGSFSFSGQDLVTATNAVDLALGQTLVLTISGVVVNAINPADTIDNTVGLTWTSLDGTVAGERTGAGGVDDYIATASASTITIPGVLEVDKTRVSPTDGTVAIGEPIDYQVEVTLVEGTTENVVLVDQLPAGVEYVAGSFQIVNAGGFTLATPTVVYDAGAHTLTITFASAASGGNIDSGSTSAIDTASFVIGYQVTTSNVVGNQNGTVLTNTVTGSGTNVPTDTDSTTTTVIEPDLSITKATTNTNIEAGDTVTYTITIQHTGASTSNAYDLNLTDALPASLTNLQIASAVIGATDVSGAFSFSGQNLVTAANAVDLALGQTLVLTITGVATNAVNPGETIDNTVDLTWTSLDGTNSGERTGADGVGGVLNDYAATASASTLTVPGVLEVDKTRTSSATVSIGETVDYQVAVTLVEGTTLNLQLLDQLPDDLAYVAGSFTIVDANGFALAGQNVSYNAATRELTVTWTSATAPGVTDSGSNSAIDTATFTIGYSAVVLDTASNNAGDIKTNTITGTGTNVPTDSDSTNVVIIEPTLDITKVTTNTGIEAGDTVTYTITVQHTATSSGAAYDLDFSDTFSGSLTNLQVVSATIGGVDISGAFTFSGQDLVTATNAVDLLQGQTLVLTLSGVVVGSINPADTIDNTVDLTWTSADGTHLTERTYTDSATATTITIPGVLEVDKTRVSPTDGTVAIGEAIDYQVEVTLVEGTTENVVLVDQLPAGVEYVPGSFSVVNTGGFTLSTPTVVYDSGTHTLTITFASAASSGNVDSGSTSAIDTASFVIGYQVTTSNVVGNQAGTVLTNGVTGTATNTPTDTDSTTTVVIEPVLSITKATTNTNVEAGDTVTYTITIQHTGASTSNAYDLNLTDALPAELGNLQVVSATIGGTNVSGSFSFSGQDLVTAANAVDLALGQTLVLTISGVVVDAINPADTIDNTIDLTWTSLDGTVAGERTGAGGVDDYAATASASTLTVPGVLEVDKTRISPATASIGDTVSYQVAVTIIEGTTLNLQLLDQLPDDLEYVAGSFTIVDANGVVLSGQNVSYNAATRDLTITWTSATAPGDTDSGATTAIDTTKFTIGYNAVVLDTANNNAGDTKTNTVTGTGTNVPTDTDNTDVTLIEPELDVTKVTTNTGIEAGDTVTYTITVQHTGTSSGAAYDLDFSDTFSGDLTNLQVVSATIGGVDISGAFTFSGQDLVTAANAVDLLQGQTLVLTLSGVVVGSINPADTIDNTVDLTWTSTNGTNTSERIYTDSASAATITIPGVLEVDKTRVSPTDGTVAIGEAIDYQVEITLVEGTTQNVVLVDQLPTGVEYVNGSFSVVNTGGFTLSTPTVVYDAGAHTLTITFASAVSGGNADSGSTSTIDTASFVIGYQVTTSNVVGNQDGTVLTNTVTGSATNTPTDTDSTTTVVIEPVLSITKTTSNTNVEAGDTVTYTITIQHTGASTSNAYDLNLTDTLPAELSNLQVVSATIGGTNVSGSFSFSGQDLVTAANAVDLALGQTLVLTISGVVVDAINPADTIDNTIDLTWTSLDGTVAGERTGADGVGGALDDYAATASASTLTVPGVLEVDKTRVNPTDGTAAIGENVDYQVEVTLVEGTTENVVLVDQLPAGAEYVPGSFAILNAGRFTLTPPTVVYDTVAHTLTITFASAASAGNVDSGSSSAIDTASFVVGYQTKVSNIVANQAGVVLQNTVTGSATNTPTDTDSTVTTIVEPVLSITKTTLASNVEAGDTVTYTIVVQHTGASTSAAYDLDLSDTLPAELRSLRIVSATIGGVDVSAAFSFSGQDLVTAANSIDLLLGQTLLLRVAGVVVTTIHPGDTIDNTVDLTWTSLDGTITGERTGVDGPGGALNDYANTASAPTLVVPGVLEIDKTRTSPGRDDTATIGETIDYRIDVTVIEGTTQNVVLVDRLPDGTTYTPGSAHLVTNGGGVLSPIDVVYDAATNRLTMTFANVVMPGRTDSGLTGRIDTGTFAVGYQVRVLDVPQNVNGHVLTNVVSASATNTPFDVDATRTTIIEPKLTVIKSVDVEGGQVALGQTVTYTLTVTHQPSSSADAFDVILSDLVPDGLVNVDVKSVSGSAGVTGLRDRSHGDTIRVEADELPLDGVITITFTAVVAPTTRPGETLDNNVRIYWDTIGDDDGNRVFNGQPSPIDRDYGAVPGFIEKPNSSADPAQDTERLKVGRTTLGDTVWQDTNRNGVQDGNEPGIASAVVWIDWNNNGVRDRTEPSATTDANGRYTITGLVPGEYTVRLDASGIPGGLQEVYLYDDPRLGGSPTLGSSTTQVSLPASGTTAVDFGYAGSSIPGGGTGGSGSPGGGGSDRGDGIDGLPNSIFDSFFTNTFNPLFTDDEEDELPVLGSPYLYTAGFPLFTGHAPAGSSVQLVFETGSGDLFYSNAVLVGAGGNWMFTLPDAQLNGPIHINTLVFPHHLSAMSTDDSFNFRMNYATGIGGLSMSRQGTVNDVFSAVPSARMEAISAGYEQTANFSGWEQTNYEFLAQPAVPGK